MRGVAAAAHSSVTGAFQSSRSRVGFVVLWAMAAGLMLSLCSGSVAARGLAADQLASLKSTIAEFDAAMRAEDYGIVVKTIPPKVIEHISKQAKIEVEPLKAFIVQTMKTAMQTVKLISFGMDVDAIEQKELANGAPYAMVPTSTVMDAGTGKVAIKSHTLALLDNSTWYLLRIEEVAQVEILKQVYPEFAGVVFPTGSVEAIKD